jgi:zinc/manganese transport system substrate-binding protein
VGTVGNARLREQIAGEKEPKVGASSIPEALSDATGPAAYVDMMRHNITTIRGAIPGN